MIDRPARDKLIGRLQWILDGEATLESLDTDPVTTKDESVMTIIEEISQNRNRLPLSADDDLNRPSPQGRAMIERAILLLHTDLELTPEPMGWMDRVVLASLAVFIAGLITELISQDRLIPAVAMPVRVVSLVAGGLFLLRLMATYFVSLCIGAAHIWKVRVLKRTVSDLQTDDHWPFTSESQMKQAKSLMLTASAPS